MSEAESAERAGNKSGQAPQGEANRVAELQVTAHLMTLESGLFCVFQAPGSPPADPVTSLPGVRITPAPGMAGRPEAVSVSTFREDGWLNGTAALVRVTDGTAQILVTIYQDKGQDAAPKLQVLRLSADNAAPPAAQTDAAAAIAPEPAPPSGPSPEVMAHVQRQGDMTCNLGEWIGTKGSGNWIEGFGLAPNSGVAHEDIEYQAILGRNWLSPWSDGGKYCGSRGMALPLLGIKVRLKGEAAKAWDLSYSATFVDGSATGPIAAGEPCEADSMAALEAFQVVLRPSGAKPAPAPKPAERKPARPRPAPVARPRPKA